MVASGRWINTLCLQSHYSDVFCSPFTTPILTSPFVTWHFCALFSSVYYCRPSRNGGVVIVLKLGDLDRVMKVNHWPSIYSNCSCVSPALYDIVYAFLSDCRSRARWTHPCVLAIKVHNYYTPSEGLSQAVACPAQTPMIYHVFQNRWHSHRLRVVFSLPNKSFRVFAQKCTNLRRT